MQATEAENVDNDGENATVATPQLRARPLLHYKELSLGTQTKKAKFTCVHASENFLACGTSNGAVHLYATSVNRSDASDAKRTFPAKYHLVKMISPPSNNDRIGVSCLSICPAQKRLVVGTSRGVVYGILLTDYNKIGEKVEFSHDFHSGFPVTCLLWDRQGVKLYSACNGGMVALTTVRAGVSAFFGKADTELLLKEETGIVQLDLAKYSRADILMVSSQLRVLLLNLSVTDGNAVQIGTKARQGTFGACFFTSASDEEEIAKRTNIKVFSARPGRRVWVADPQTGKVSATLKFSLTKNPTNFLQSPECQLEEGIQPRDLTINKLSLFQFLPDSALPEKRGERSLLVSWNVGTSVLFLLDPLAVEIVEWHLDLGAIHDLKVVSDTVMVVLHGEGPKVSIVQSCTARTFLDIYAGEDVKKAVELAVEYQINDLPALESLKTQWSKLLETRPDTDNQATKLTAELDALHSKARELHEMYQKTESGGVPGITTAPLQVIFKQRPQQQQQPSQLPVSNVPDLFAANTDNGYGSTAGDKAVTLGTSGLHRTEGYSGVNSPSYSYSRSIYAPDGSTIEAQLIDINEISHGEAVIRDDYMESWMEDIADEIRRFEAMKPDDSINILPALRGTLNHTGAAAKAITTYIPGANMISNLVDTAVNANYSELGSAVFGDLSDMDTLVLDPVDYRPVIKADTYECAVLRIAMSSATEDERNQDSEVLMEAISMDIWDSRLKYISNLPIEQQISLPEAVKEEEDLKVVSKPKKEVKPYQNKKIEALSSEKPATIRKSRSATSLTIDSSPTTAESPTLAIKRNPGVNRHSSLSPDSGRSAQRALMKYIGGGPNCDFERRCMVSGQLATSPEIEPLLKREVCDLISELQSATMAADKPGRHPKKLWPTAGITRVCACLTSMYLFEGDLDQVEMVIKWWLACFDPTAKPEDQVPVSTAPLKSKANGTSNKQGSLKGSGRGEGLVDGDTLPLTRSDWSLVRVLITLYFAVRAGGPSLLVRPATPADLNDDPVKPYAYELGAILEFAPSSSNEPDNSAASLWPVNEAQDFIAKYGVYLNSEVAAHVCNLRKMSGTLNAVLDQVVSSSNMASICDDVINWIAEKQTEKALKTIKETESLCLLLHVLDLLLKKCPAEAVELSVAKYPILAPWNVERCLFGMACDNEDLQKPENVTQTANYFRYLVRLIEVWGDEVGKDCNLVDRCVKLCFGGAKIVGKLFETEDRSNRITWLCRIFNQPVRYKYTHASAWEMCVKNHATVCLVELAHQSLISGSSNEQGLKELDFLMGTIIEKSELSLLEEVFTRLSTIPNAAEIVSKVLHHIENAAGKGDEELITTVIHSLLNSVGTKDGMQILAQCPLLFAASPLSLYQSIIESHVLSQRQLGELDRMLEAVDTQVWAAYKESSRSDGICLAPQVQAIFDLERHMLKTTLDDTKFGKWQSKRDRYESELAEYRHLTGPSLPTNEKMTITADAPHAFVSRAFEYRSSDWGGDVQLHDATCGVCDLPVVIIADDNSNLEVKLLSCGHAYHSMCISDSACPICFESGFDSLIQMW
ncbi:hypothetical protein Poli38472_008335 [Pythium oligandrum]|uniref:RING-type domain-containing protein n=1 Tax=Pythium oligandrum TaxID=41045 RepID=A0A8K1CNV4_PYTOL|nr:hypothetical protein Poli38472_008335 [Pythium oligandrum]|eukprot:TMW65693.1 hypothetical protein Poli38472_008335 [Pythium oligandrum]